MINRSPGVRPAARVRAVISAEQMIASHMGAYAERNGVPAPCIVLSQELYFDWLIEKGKPGQGGIMYGCPFRVERDWPGRCIATPLPTAKATASPSAPASR